MNNLKKRLLLSIIINSVLLVLEAIVLSNCYFSFIRNASSGTAPHNLMFRFFTEDSNLLLAVSSLIYIIFGTLAYKKGTPLPFWVKRFRLISVTAVTTTFAVVLLFLNPYAWHLYGQPFLMFSWPNMIFTHLLFPLTSIFSFLALEEDEKPSQSFYKESCWSLLSIAIYAAVVGTLASNHLISSDQTINNVYGFMDVTAGKWWQSPLAFILIFLGTYLEAFGLLKGQKAIAGKRQAAQ